MKWEGGQWLQRLIEVIRSRPAARPGLVRVRPTGHVLYVYKMEAWGGTQVLEACGRPDCGRQLEPLTPLPSKVLEACGRRGEDAALALHEQGDTGFEPAAVETWNE